MSHALEMDAIIISGVSAVLLFHFMGIFADAVLLQVLRKSQLDSLLFKLAFHLVIACLLSKPFTLIVALLGYLPYESTSQLLVITNIFIYMRFVCCVASFGILTRLVIELYHKISQPSRTYTSRQVHWNIALIWLYAVLITLPLFSSLTWPKDTENQNNTSRIKHDFQVFSQSRILNICEPKQVINCRVAYLLLFIFGYTVPLFIGCYCAFKISICHGRNNKQFPSHRIPPKPIFSSSKTSKLFSVIAGINYLFCAPLFLTLLITAYAKFSRSGSWEHLLLYMWVDCMTALPSVLGPYIYSCYHPILRRKFHFYAKLLYKNQQQEAWDQDRITDHRVASNFRRYKLEAIKERSHEDLVLQEF